MQIGKFGWIQAPRFPRLPGLLLPYWPRGRTNRREYSERHDEDRVTTIIFGLLQIEGAHHRAIVELVARFAEPAVHECGDESIRANFPRTTGGRRFEMGWSGSRKRHAGGRHSKMHSRWRQA